MSKTKKQHFVPRSYLQRFAAEQDPESIWVFDKVDRRSFRSHLMGIANERYFYDFGESVLAEIAERLRDVPDSELPAEAKRRLLDPQFVEHDLARMEEGFAATLEEMLNSVDEAGGFTHDQQERMAYYLTRQMLRLPEFRAMHIERINKFVNEYSQMLVAMKFGPSAVGRVNVSLEANHEAYEHARMMYDPKLNGTFISIFMDRYIWHIGVNRTDMPLYTSDNPIIMRSHLGQQPYGIGSPGIEIMFPLSPSHVLILAERQVFASSIMIHRRTTNLRPENVLYYNSGQVLQGYRQVYSSVSRFELAVDVCARHPEVCVPKRERIQVVGGLHNWLQEEANRAEQPRAD